jgi:hypothetical protein
MKSLIGVARILALTAPASSVPVASSAGVPRTVLSGHLPGAAGHARIVVEAAELAFLVARRGEDDRVVGRRIEGSDLPNA